MSDSSLPRLKLIPMAIAVLMGSAAVPSFAVPVTSGNITLDAQYTLDGGAASGGTNLGNVFTNSTGADFYLSNNTASSSIFFHTYGFSDPSYTSFGARASGYGTFTASTRSSYSSVITNNSSVAQLFTFSFDVLNGENGLYGTGDGSADLLLRVRRDGVDWARDHTTITQTAGVVNCASDDLGTLGGYMNCASPTSNSEYANGGLFSVNMGVVGPNESFVLDYDIIATISGAAAAATGTHTVCSYNGYGYGGGSDSYGGYGGGGGSYNCHEEPNFSYFSAIARSGDPFGSLFIDNNGNLTDGTNGVSLNGAFSDVPEPGSLALVGLALAGLAAARRKKADPGA